jgi:hypothetical protein
MDIHKIKLLFNTILYLKPVQVYYRLYYFLRNIFIGKKVKKKTLANFNSIVWENEFNYENSYLDKDNSFVFLNLSHSFSDKIDWNYNRFGKLWTYNLNYFDYLNQENISKETGIILIKDYIKNDNLLLDGKEPYPISLRGINWVKFLSKNKVNEEFIDNNLYNHYYILLKNIEYHLLGNHLLENAFSLLFGSFYFQDEKLYNKSKKILITELNEQILEDGSHFELSPMYHQIMLFRVLDCIQLIKLNSWKNDDLLNLLEECSSKMLSWLYKITFNNGDIPMINDCAFQIAPSTKALLNYGKLLEINKKNIKLSDSGYRMFKNEKYELFMDMGEVGASYQPGHVHSDTFNFVLYANNQPFIVDTGTSTYEKNDRRQVERSTSSHNTITIGDYEQTQVWGGFRVAKRAKIVSLKESSFLFSSSHNGYKNIGVIHNRKFIANKDSINIFDDLNKQEVYEQIAHFHFHPSIKNIIIKDSRVYFKNSNIEISFNGKSISIEKECYEYAHGFNKTENAVKLKVVFKSNLETTIYT